MTWTLADHRAVVRTLIGTWPDTLGEWGRHTLTRYVSELEARGLQPDQVLAAIRGWQEDSNFPPAIPKLAAAARRDPSAPTFTEMLRLIYGPGGVMAAQPAVRVFPDMAERERAYHQARIARARELHPLVGAFVHRYGLQRLAGLELDHPDHGGLKRQDLEREWDAHVQVMDGRDAAALAAGERRGEMGRFDPLSLGGGDRPELTSGTSEGLEEQ